jgi:hypothetical protein
MFQREIGGIVDGTSPAYMPASSLQGRINGRRATAFPATMSSKLTPAEVFSHVVLA